MNRVERVRFSWKTVTRVNGGWWEFSNVSHPKFIGIYNRFHLHLKSTIFLYGYAWPTHPSSVTIFWWSIEMLNKLISSRSSRDEMFRFRVVDANQLLYVRTLEKDKNIDIEHRMSTLHEYKVVVPTPFNRNDWTVVKT